MANEIKLLFLPGKDKEPGRIPCDSQTRETEISASSLFSSFSISSISFYAFHASFPVEYSKDIGGSFLLEADASVAVSTSELLSIALHTNDKLQISIRARRVRERKRPTAQRLTGKLFASRCAQKANLRMRCAIALMPVRPAGPSLDFDQV